MPNFYCLDERDVWHKAACEAARSHGYAAKRIFSGETAEGPGVGFIRPHADWRQLPANREDYARMVGAGMTMTNYYGVSVSRDGRWLQVSSSEGTEPRIAHHIYHPLPGTARKCLHHITQNSTLRAVPPTTPPYTLLAN